MYPPQAGFVTKKSKAECVGGELGCWASWEETPVASKNAELDRYLSFVWRLS